MITVQYIEVNLQESVAERRGEEGDTIKQIRGRRKEAGGKRKEERGRRNEEGGTRNEERGTRQEERGTRVRLPACPAWTSFVGLPSSRGPGHRILRARVRVTVTV